MITLLPWELKVYNHFSGNPRWFKSKTWFDVGFI